MAEDNSGAGKKELLKAVVVLAIALSGWFIPAFPPITEIGMRCITVFLIYSFCRFSRSGRALFS